LSESQSYMPDFIFEEGQETFVELDKIKSLSKWSLDAPECLLNTILELLQHYKVMQF
jgi:hypothetical protein